MKKLEIKYAFTYNQVFVLNGILVLLNMFILKNRVLIHFVFNIFV